MRRILALALILGMLSFSAAGLAGCGGGTESGTKQISEKSAPDSELNPAQPKGAQSRKPSR